MSDSIVIEEKTKLSQEVLKDKKIMEKNKIAIIIVSILLAISTPITIVLILMEIDKIPTSLNFIAVALLTPVSSAVFLVSFIMLIVCIKTYRRGKHDYNWDLDAIEDGYKYLEDALGEEDEVEEELEKRNKKREEKKKKRG